MKFRYAMTHLLPVALTMMGVAVAAAQPPSATSGTRPPPPAVGLANPASVNCLKQGGTLQMRQEPRGTYGVCVFKGGRECEEWALFRGECPVGGLPPAKQDKRKASEGKP